MKLFSCNNTRVSISKHRGSLVGIQEMIDQFFVGLIQVQGNHLIDSHLACQLSMNALQHNTPETLVHLSIDFRAKVQVLYTSWPIRSSIIKKQTKLFTKYQHY